MIHQGLETLFGFWSKSTKMCVLTKCFRYNGLFILCVLYTAIWQFILIDGSPENQGEGLYSANIWQRGGSSAFLKKLLNNRNLKFGAIDCESDEPSLECDPKSPYRTLDGSCNNLDHPSWGMIGDCLLRILPAAYEGKAGIRKSMRGNALPEPRILSLNIFSNFNRPERKVNFWFTVFGQAIAHDQSESTPPIGPGLVKAGITCCPPSAATNPDCSPIMIPPNDPFFSKRNITCIEFLRGINCNKCKNTNKQQITTVVSAAIDAHLIYGLSKTESDELRTNDETGRLKVQDTKKGHDLPPANNDVDQAFCPTEYYKDCFRSGDVRVNQHVFLTSVHTILMREHNRIADELKHINPHWNGEQIFQTARKLVGAKMQVIVYQEYLPLLLGEQYMSKFGLQVRKDGKGTRYDPTLPFGVFVEYSSATYRAHSMIVKDTGYDEFRFLYMTPFPLLGGNLSRIVKGSCMRHSQKYDHFNVEDITNYLYKFPHDDFGLDLVAIDIHRSRDHGMPTYIDVLNYCSITNKVVTKFDELEEVMPKSNIRLLKQNYKDIRDVDLYVGMQMENIMKDSVLPPTSACIIAGQYYFMKYADRFYFEHVGESGSFTAAQRESLKKFNMNRLICANTDVKELQKNAFENSRRTVTCHSTRGNDVDLTLWKSTS